MICTRYFRPTSVYQHLKLKLKIAGLVFILSSVITKIIICLLLEKTKVHLSQVDGERPDACCMRFSYVLWPTSPLPLLLQLSMECRSYMCFLCSFTVPFHFFCSSDTRLRIDLCRADADAAAAVSSGDIRGIDRSSWKYTSSIRNREQREMANTCRKIREWLFVSWKITDYKS